MHSHLPLTREAVEVKCNREEGMGNKRRGGNLPPENLPPAIYFILCAGFILPAMLLFHLLSQKCRR